jgi:hypothetical protein
LDAIPTDHREGLSRVRHYLAHASMGLHTYESVARAVLGEEAFAQITQCLERSRGAIDAWLNF